MASPLAAQFFPQTVQVPMDDQVTLATDVWRNFLDSTPRPVLLRRTPYGRALDAATAANFMNAGFIVVSQDVRGEGASGGTFLPFFTDKQDGRATIDWIAAQPWSSGRVGTYSASAEGIVQYMAMAAAPDALACAHIMMATPDVYEGVFPGGAWRTDLGTAWLQALIATSVIDAWKTHEAKDGYWDAATLSKAEMAKVDHPVFLMGGFFDIFSISEHNAAKALQENVSPSSRGDVYVVLGPWTHGGFGSTRQGQLSFPNDATMPSFATDFVQYLNWCLLGAGRPPFANVRYWMTELTDDTLVDTTDQSTRIVTKGEWHDDTVWPPAASTTRALYLQDTHQLGTTGAAAPIPLLLDPSNPTPSVGGGNFVSAAGPFEQATVDARADVYTATSAPFTEETLLVGAPHASIWAASATDDVDVVVRLEVVTPGGRSILFSDGIRRGRFVTGYDAIRPLTPNQPAAFDIEMNPIALRLPAGYALRVAIAGASSPRYEPNPNSSAALASHPVVVANTLTIYRDAQHPSRIDLPLLSGSVPGSALIVESTPSMDGGVLPVSDAGTMPGSGLTPPGRAHDAASPDAGFDVDAGSDAGAHDGGCACRVDGRSNDLAPSRWLGFGLGLAWLLRRRAARARVARARLDA